LHFVPALDTYSCHLHADAWEALPQAPWGLEEIARKARELALHGLQSTDMKHFERYRDSQGVISTDAVLRLREIFQGLELSFELGTGGTDVEHLKDAARLAEALGAKVVRTFIGGGSWHNQAETVERLRRAEASLRLLLPLLDELDLSIGVENHQDVSTDECLALINAVASPRVGVCLDTGNQFGVLENAPEASMRLATCAVTLHVKDYHLLPVPAGGYVLVGAVPGTGCAAVRQTLAEVRKQAQAAGRSSIQANLECAVEYIPVTPARRGWRDDCRTAARLVVEAVLPGGAPSGEALATLAHMETLQKEHSTEAALRFEDEMLERGAAAMLQLLEG